MRTRRENTRRRLSTWLRVRCHRPRHSYDPVTIDFDPCPHLINYLVYARPGRRVPMWQSWRHVEKATSLPWRMV